MAALTATLTTSLAGTRLNAKRAPTQRAAVRNARSLTTAQAKGRYHHWCRISWSLLRLRAEQART